MSDLLVGNGFLAALRRHYLFSAMDDEVLQQLSRNVRPMELAADEVLFRQGDPADYFYLLTDGRIKLVMAAEEGQEKVIELIHPGQTFAEAVQFMQRRNYPVTALAVRPSRVLAVSGRAYLDLLHRNPDACIRILGDISMRLHGRLNEVLDLSQQNATHRIVRYLLRQLPRNAENGVTIYLDTPKQDIASLLAVKPETFSRVFSRLGREEIIKVKGREIKVLDIERLQAFE